MKNIKKRGFTLVEILSTVVILGIILTLSFATYKNIKNNSLKTTYENKMNVARIASVKYGEEHKDEIWENKECVFKSIYSLINEGYLTSDSKDKIEYLNPINNSDVSSRGYNICFENGVSTSYIDFFPAYLKNLSTNIGPVTPVFKKDILKYEIIVPASTTSLDIDAELPNTMVAFLNDYGPRTVNLSSNPADNVFDIKVETVDDSLTYTLTVKFEAPYVELANYTTCGADLSKICPTASNINTFFTYTGSYKFISDGEDCHYRIKFLKSGTLTMKQSIAVDTFLVGGGSGANKNDGGTGGYTATYFNDCLKKGQSYTITVGAGGGLNGNGGATKITTADKSINMSVAGGTTTKGATLGGLGSNCSGSEGDCHCSKGSRGGTSYGNGGQGTTTCEFGMGTTSGCKSGVTAYSGGGGGGGDSHTSCHKIEVTSSHGNKRRDCQRGTSHSCSTGGTSAGVSGGGTANTGGGGNGQGAGGSGILIIRDYDYTRGAIYSGSKMIATYTGYYKQVEDVNGKWQVELYTSGDLYIYDKLAADIFLVGGGSGGLSNGDGGNGGYTKTYKNVSLPVNNVYQITIGTGGAVDANGKATTFKGKNDSIYAEALGGTTTNGGSAGGKGSKCNKDCDCNKGTNGSSYGTNGQNTTTCAFGGGSLTGCNAGVKAYAGGGGGSSSSNYYCDQYIDGNDRNCVTGHGHTCSISGTSAGVSGGGSENTGGGGFGKSSGGTGIVVLRSKR